MLADPLLDMRIAAWMLTPEDKKLRDDSTATLAAGAVYTCESLLRQAGPAAVEAVGAQAAG